MRTKCANKVLFRKETYNSAATEAQKRDYKSPFAGKLDEKSDESSLPVNQRKSKFSIMMI